MVDFEHSLEEVETPEKTSAPSRLFWRPVLAAAMDHPCAILLSGGKTHFGPFYGQTRKGVEIHSPTGLARKLQAESNFPKR